MPLWTKEIPPKYHEKIGRQSVATNRGWEDANRNEILVAIPQLATIAAEANVFSASFDKDSYVQADPVKIVIRYNEKVNVTAGATVVLSWTGVSGNITAYAAAQLGVSEVVFDKDALNADLLIPAEAGDLSIAAQSIVGTIVDANDGVTASELAISAAIALAAGTKTVV